MARIRYLKPEAAEDLTLAKTSIAARLLYRDIWCHMDRNGLIEYDTKFIKAKIFPYDDDLTANKVGKLVQELIEVGRLFPILFNGKSLLFCPNLLKHQKFHIKEKAKFAISLEEINSLLSAPSQHHTSTPTSTPTSRMGNGELVMGNGELVMGNEQVRPTAMNHPMVLIWNDNRGELSEVKGVGPKRLAAMKARWGEKPDREYWVEVVKIIANSDFCLGRKNVEGPHANWRADFDFLLRPETHHKAMEGKYSNREINKSEVGVDPAILKIRRELGIV